ncbi:MAG: ACT domain-containing protein, partial [Bacteroidota bacterium]
MLNPTDYLQNCQVEIWSRQFAVVKAKYVPENFVAVFQDQQEITVISEEQYLNDDWVVEAEQDWRMLSFRVTLPFELVGFLAVVAQVLADAQISIFALSAYSTDHLLIKNSDLTKAIHCLESLGCMVMESP